MRVWLVACVVLAGCAGPAPEPVAESMPDAEVPSIVQIAIQDSGGAALMHNIDGVARGWTLVEGGSEFSVPVNARNASVVGQIEYACDNPCSMVFHVWRNAGGAVAVLEGSSPVVVDVELVGGDYWIEARPRGQGPDDALAHRLAWSIDAMLSYETAAQNAGPNRPS